MRRLITLVSALAFLPLAASAQNENVVVTGQQSMTGMWKFHNEESEGPFNGSGYCRVRQTDDDLAIRCMGGGKWSGTLNGATFHISTQGYISFNHGPLTAIPGGWLVLDAALDSPTAFHGTGGIKLIGFTIFQSKLDKKLQMTGTKFVLPENTPDGSGKGGLLKTVLQELGKGAIQMPHAPDLTSNFGRLASANKPEDIRSLGDIQGVIYLGEDKSDRWDGKKELPPFLFSVYQVEFTNGERLCGIHQRDDGAVDGFLCV